MMKNAMTAPIAAAPMRPPTTPPAIAPAFELLLCCVAVGLANPPDWFGVTVDWETLTVEGMTEAVPVTSGVSGRHLEYVWLDRVERVSDLLRLRLLRGSSCHQSAKALLMRFRKQCMEERHAQMCQ